MGRVRRPHLGQHLQRNIRKGPIYPFPGYWRHLCMCSRVQEEIMNSSIEQLVTLEEPMIRYKAETCHQDWQQAALSLMSTFPG